MNAAIYARRSTDQPGKSDEDKSVTRQVENARAFAVSRGWTVADEHIYVDDGISGAEFKKRRAFQRLMDSLKPKPPFKVLIVSEQKSIGREMSETGYVIKQLAEAGVEIYEYVHGRSLTPKNYLDKAISSLQGMADEAHRAQTSERVHEAHTRLAKAGRVTGGRVYGYRNKKIPKGEDRDGNILYSHTERIINPEEALVVRRIYRLYDEGEGLKRIAKRLNSEGVKPPEPFKRKNADTDLACPTPMTSWAPSTLRTILNREIYHGVIVWNRSRKRNDWGKVDQKMRPESEWVRVPAEGLRIIYEQQ